MGLSEEEQQRFEELDNLPRSFWKETSERAWEETMKPDCDCGASERRECRCRRTEEYKKRAREIRERFLGENWDEEWFKLRLKKVGVL